MRSHARAVVVGGGAVGCSIAYHLAKGGWTDTVLLERDELTAGSTWHAAGLLPLFNMSYAVGHIHDYSVKFYQMLQSETGPDVGFRRVGNLCVAQTRDRMDEYRLYAATAESVGVEHLFLTPREIAERWPLVRADDLAGALFHPGDGYINPADVTQAMARGARKRGVEIVRRAQVDGFARRGGAWVVRGRLMGESGGRLTPAEPFEIVAEVVVTATGNHAQRTAAMVGCFLPAIPVEHQYIVTEPDPRLLAWRETNPEHPVLRDADARWYVREERGGWVLGPYERGAPAWAVHGVPEGFRADLLPLDLERIDAEVASFNRRIPSSERAGLKDDYNGPICYTPDGNPLVGPAPGVPNFYLAEGFSFGITAARGTGHYLAQLITQGEAEIDLWPLDPRRFGRWMNRDYAARKNEEAYAHVFILHHPDEERPARRPLRTAPCHDRLKARGPQFGQVDGWERPTYLAPADFDDRAARSFRRGGFWPYAGAEARAARQGCGLYEAAAFAKHRVRAAEAKRGDLGWELHHPIETQNALFDALMATDAAPTPVGARAMNWLRQEKSYRACGANLGRDASPLESGRDRFVDRTEDFRGRAAMAARGVRAACVTLVMDGPADADPWGREALWAGGRVVGRLTSGGWSVTLGRRIGLGYVPPDMAAPGTRLRVRIMGELLDAAVIADSPHDPANARPRAED